MVFEYTYFDTDYRNTPDGQAQMAWTSMIFDF